jgi:hypothetical protein
VVADNVEAGCDEAVRLADGALDAPAFHAAVAGCLARGLIREPVRLPEGALQCHWHLELTPAGVAAARNQSGRDEGCLAPDRPSVPRRRT